MIAALKTKMRWHEVRQGVLAENVANASTPNFRGQDLAPPELSEPGPAPTRTDARHMTLASIQEEGRARNVDGFARTPDGNSVTLEEQMAKAAQNQMDHQMAAMLYSKSLGLLRTALGRR
ncbi:MAG: flagellar basal-body rod protein FlgB [Ancylobacter novellus]|uniref:Flagellar basal-body rod protein FlgB n=1 Tax=Ancylobacter novellus TaxID=921 RepID=A0A2W5MZZ7_ANCNO|nr:MAG: flagellar basal-body rod protein FlgB [Ancylobacter novellus]